MKEQNTFGTVRELAKLQSTEKMKTKLKNLCKRNGIEFETGRGLLSIYLGDSVFCVGRDPYFGACGSVCYRGDMVLYYDRNLLFNDIINAVSYREMGF